MKLFKIVSIYPAYLEQFYARHPEVSGWSYAEQLAAVNHDAFSLGDAWVTALRSIGYDAEQVVGNSERLQTAWARENGVTATDLEDILIEQVKRAKPDILWFDSDEEHIIARLRHEVSSLRLVLGWVGSPFPPVPFWQHVDLMLSCAPESVKRIRAAGFAAEHLDHSWDPRINERLENQPKRISFSFIGQIVRGSEFHNIREQILESLRQDTELTIFSPAAEVPLRRDVSRYVARTMVYFANRGLARAGVPERALSRLPLISKASRWKGRPVLMVNPKLRPYLKPGVFGLDMYQTIKDSRVTLNIHADSSPTHASNMRLFETTGVGTCLLTDWRDNLPELFVPDSEVVAYKTPAECAEKVRWLLDHPSECEAIAKAGHRRLLRDHTITHRAARLDEIIKKHIRQA